MLSGRQELRREQFFDRLEEVGSAVLALDYDGTLAPFKKDRNAAVPYPGVRKLIGQIMAKGHTRVVIISGRPVHEVQSLLQLTPSPEIWGAHGLQRLRSNGECETGKIEDSDRALLGEAIASVRRYNFDRLAEVKPGSVAVHWRGLPEAETQKIRSKLQPEWAPIAASGRMSLLEFDGGIELRVNGFDKGKVARTIISELPPGTPFAFLGDDATDEDAFRVLQGNGGFTILVRDQWRETEADVWIRPPEELFDFLTEWLKRSGGEP
jgi:trehalose-phosphatase